MSEEVVETTEEAQPEIERVDITDPDARVYYFGRPDPAYTDLHDGILTIVTKLRREDNTLFAGFALCCPRDSWNKKKGRNKAAERAMLPNEPYFEMVAVQGEEEPKEVERIFERSYTTPWTGSSLMDAIKIFNHDVNRHKLPRWAKKWFLVPSSCCTVDTKPDN